LNILLLIIHALYKIFPLSLHHALNINENFPIILPISNLNDLSLHLSSVTFDEFEILISKIDAKLKILRVHITFDDRINLDARRWEQLISQHLPEFEKFSNILISSSSICNLENIPS
jgi:hypothetical protein